MTDIDQRTDEWRILDENLLNYHLAQWEEQKRSTIFFESFCKRKLANSKKVLDLAGGSGGATFYFANNNPFVQFICSDYVEEVVKCGASIAQKKGIANLKFDVDDMFNLSERADIDGVISMQTLSWLPEYEKPLAQIMEKISPKWMAFTSLFYDGDITAKTEICENQRGGRKSYYNTYSIPEFARFCKRYGYSLETAEEFKIDIDIPKPENSDLMGTYTIKADKSDNVERYQVSGPLLMNWKMLMLERD